MELFFDLEAPDLPKEDGCYVLFEFNGKLSAVSYPEWQAFWSKKAEKPLGIWHKYDNEMDQIRRFGTCYRKVFYQDLGGRIY